MTDLITYAQYQDEERKRRQTFITANLSRCGWDVARTAEVLQVKESDLRNWIEWMGIEEVA